MAMIEETKSRWEAKTSAELPGATTEQVWPLIADFCNVQKWIPIETCYQVEGGIAGQPGLTRYCAGTVRDSDDPEKTMIKWAKEKLLMIDPIKKCLSYEVVDSNMGFKSYVATLKVEDEEKPEGGCKIEWSYVCDPVEGWTFESLFSMIQSFIQAMANNMELARICEKVMISIF